LLRRSETTLKADPDIRDVAPLPDAVKSP